MPSFRTKRGRCHLDGDTLRIESSIRGYARRLREGNRLLFWAYVVAMLVAVGTPFSLILWAEYQDLGLVLGGVALVVVLARVGNYLRGFTGDEEIPLEDVARVTATEGTKGLTRPRFVVEYDRNGDHKKRYVVMPSLWLDYGEETFDRAKTAFREAGLPVEES
ncbi:hypothetical protein [Halorientalis pallida]|uniref:Uncharacterized protein n=1 Tax=Halorientalis pallida TaxID=2479928 RepID=A0A498L5A8_9EURY|nr:hypothetical protein [Halorientalis pallida]RXK50457.1 hypothetical protein EAF64_07865 [Halorientalis pallida]